MNTKPTSTTEPTQQNQSVVARPYPQWVLAFIFSSWVGNVLVWPGLEAAGFDAFWFAAIFGFMFGQAIVLAIYGGLYGVSWTDGFVLGCLILAVAMYANLLGMRHGLTELWWMPFISPGLVLVGYVPLMTMRHLYDWRLVRPGKSYPTVPASLSGIFGNVVIVMAAVISLRAPPAFIKVPTDPGTYWIPVIAIGLTLCVFSALTSLPVAAFILNCENGAVRFGRALTVMVVAILGLGAFLAINAAWNGPPPTGVYRDVAVGAIAATTLVYLGVLAIRADGYRLRTRVSASKRTESSVTADEVTKDQHAQDALARYQKRIRWQIVNLVLLMIPLNIWFSKAKAKKDAFYAVQSDLSAIANKHAGTFSGQFGSAAYASLQSFDDASMAEFTSKLRDHDFEFENLDMNGAAIDDESLPGIGGIKRIDLLDLSNTKITGERFAELANTEITTLRLLGLDLTNADWGSLPNSIAQLDVDNSKVSSPTFAAFLLRQNLQSISVGNLEITEDIWKSLKQKRKLNVLHAPGTGLTDDQLEPVLSTNQSFLSLDLSDTAITDKTVDLISEAGSRYSYLNLSNTEVTDSSVSNLGKQYRSTYGTVLRLSGTKVTGRCFQDWINLPFNLDLSNTPTGDEILPVLERQIGSSLQSLNLSHTNVTDETLPTLVKVNVGAVHIAGTKISAKALLTAVGKLPPGTPQVGTWFVGVDQFTQTEIASLSQVGLVVRVERQ